MHIFAKNYVWTIEYTNCGPQTLYNFGFPDLKEFFLNIARKIVDWHEK